MKSLIKKRKQSKAAPPSSTDQLTDKSEAVAQCCAKVSKAVAGCHD
jgi:hypothetical protein